MKNTIVLLACLAAPFFLTGCGPKSCDDLQQEMQDLQRKMGGDIEEAARYADEFEALIEEMIDVCADE